MSTSSAKLNMSRFTDADEATQKASEALSKILAENIQYPTLLLLSGGSALDILDLVDEGVLGEQLTISVLDERFSSDAAINNFAQLQDTDFYMKALERDTSFIGTLPRKEDTPETLAARFEHALRTWQQENPQGKIIATLGMGPDGHTAGIMPYAEDANRFKELFDYNNRWVVAYDAGDKNPYPLRITATLPFLRMIDKAIGFITGQKKKSALDIIKAKKATLPQCPAMIFWELKDLRIFTDIK